MTEDFMLPTIEDLQIPTNTVWDEIGWAYVRSGPDQNLDNIPSNVEVNFGCPKCGSVWTTLVAIGFTAPHCKSGEAVFTDAYPCVYLKDPGPIVDFRAVRLSASRSTQWSTTRRRGRCGLFRNRRGRLCFSARWRS